MCYIYMYIYKVQYYTVLKEIVLLVRTQMDFEGITLSEISKTQKETYCMISLICGIKKQNSQLIDIQNRLLVGRGKSEGWAKQVKLARSYKLPVTKQMSSDTILYI